MLFNRKVDKEKGYRMFGRLDLEEVWIRRGGRRIEESRRVGVEFEK